MDSVCPVCGEEHSGQSGGTWCIKALANKIRAVEADIAELRPRASVVAPSDVSRMVLTQSERMKEVWRKRKGAERD